MEVEGKAKINNPLPPSNKSEFVNKFEFTGALDNSPFLCIPSCFDFIEQVCGGEQAYRAYCVNLAQSGGKAVASILGDRGHGQPGWYSVELLLHQCASAIKVRRWENRDQD